MNESLQEFKSVYEDLKILSEYKVELRTKLNNVTSNTPREEKDMLDADITSLFILIQEKIDYIKELQATLLSYYEKDGLSNNSQLEQLIENTDQVIKYIYRDNSGYERFFEASLLDIDDYNEINKRVHSIEKQSKKLQPVIDGSQKAFKKQVLASSGFIESSNGKLIHSSLINDYESLLKLKSQLDVKFKNSHTLKEQFDDLLEDIKEINPSLSEEKVAEIIKNKSESGVRLLKTIEDESNNSLDVDNNEKILTSVEDIEKQISEVLKMPGRKQFVKFCGKKYYVARNKSGKLISLLSELRRIKIDQIDDGYLKNIKLELQRRGFTEEQVNILNIENLKIIIKDNPDEDLIKLLTDFINKSEIKSQTSEMIVTTTSNSISDVQFSTESHKDGNDQFFDDDFENVKLRLISKTEDGDLKKFISGVTLSQIKLHKLLTPDLDLEELILDIAKKEREAYNTVKNNLDENAKTDSDSEIKTDSDIMINADEQIKTENGSKKFTIKKIKKYIGSHSKKIIALILATLTASTLFIIMSKLKNKKVGNLEENITQEDLVKFENTNDLNNENNSSNSENIINESDYDYYIGNTVTILNNSNVKVYKSAYDAKESNNPVTPYFDSQDERCILGVTVRLNNVDYNIFAYNENANNQIEGLLLLGGKVVSVAVGNKSRVEDLKNYDGSELDYNKYIEYVEGWYNIADVNIKGSGYTK